MTSNHHTYQVGLRHVEDLRREADSRRRVRLARTGREASPSTTQRESQLGSNWLPLRALGLLTQRRAARA